MISFGASKTTRDIFKGQNTISTGPGQYNIDKKSAFPLDKLKGSSSFLSKVERVNP